MNDARPTFEILFNIDDDGDSREETQRIRMYASQIDSDLREIEELRRIVDELADLEPFTYTST